VLKNSEIPVRSNGSDAKANNLSDEMLLGIDDLRLDLLRHGLYRGCERIHLTPKPFNVLVHLVRHRGCVVTKQQLLTEVWGERRDDNTVEQAIRHLRRALQDDKDHPRFIQTISGQGYCFVGVPDTENTPAPATPGLDPAEGSRTFRPPYRHLRSAALAFLPLAAFLAFRPSLPKPALTNPVRVTRSRTHMLSPILTDGTHLYYGRFTNGRYMVAGVGASGGQSFAPTMGVSNPELCDIAPDGRSLLIRDLTHSRDDNEPVYIQSLDGGPARRVGHILAYDVAWYPDGRHILYAADGTIYRTDVQGTSSQRLFSVPGQAYWFRWSPDLRRLRFTLVDGKNQALSLWEASADGARPHPLFPAMRYQQCCGSWTSNGAFFAFQVRVENTFQVWARRETGNLFRVDSTPVPLTVGPSNYRGPLPSRDGQKLFIRAEDPSGELVRYDPGSRQFITLLPSTPIRTAAFSKDGNWIAYTSLAEDNLWRCRSDGSDCLQLTQPMQRAALPRWSPNGKTIAFMGHPFGRQWAIFTVGLNGENMHSPCGADRNDADPDWSPDGRRLVFGNQRESPDKSALYVLDLPTCGMARLPGSTGYFSPRWSPDGRFIAALHLGDQRLDVFEIASQKWQRVTGIAAGYPNWSHDGKYIYFLTRVNERRAIFRAGIQDGKVEEVMTLSNVEQGPFFLGDWVGLAPGDSPMAVRNLTTEAIYSWDFKAR
jgi:Tol biopolymer transport system component/DNA-binding winged helix-turn-helix (wHTH) protein